MSNPYNTMILEHLMETHPEIKSDKRLMKLFNQLPEPPSNIPCGYDSEGNHIN